jgi:methyl-accepting chemotaxis protein
LSGQELNMLSDIAVKVAKSETGQESTAKSIGDLASSVNRLVEKLNQSDDVAKDAVNRARSAHHRIDELKTDVTDIKGDIKWLWRTVLTAVITGAIGGAAAFIWKGIGH